MKRNLYLVTLAIGAAIFFSNCNCDESRNKLVDFNPKQKAFLSDYFADYGSYKEIFFKSTQGQSLSYSATYSNNNEQGELLKNGACPIYRMYEMKEIRYSCYKSNYDESFTLNVSSEYQPGNLVLRVNQYNPSYSNGNITVDLHNPNLVIEGSFSNAQAITSGFVQIADTTINGKKYTDLYVLRIDKLPTALSSEIKDFYLSFSKGIVAFRRVNNVVWMLE